MKKTMTFVVSYLSRKKARQVIKNICVKDLYTGYNLNDRIWTLEHVVPQSRINNNGKKNDLHNLVGISSILNKSRGNKKFGDSMFKYKIRDECRISKDLFSPFMGKGHVARTCAHMINMYGDAIDHDNLIDKNTLLRWNYDNPPDYDEKKRNELIYEIQGTYNKFIEDFTIL